MKACVAERFVGTAPYFGGTKWDETESGDSGDSVFQHQVETDTPRLGSSNKMQTNKPIITFKALHTRLPVRHLQAKAGSVFLKHSSLSVHLKMCF